MTTPAVRRPISTALVVLSWLPRYVVYAVLRRTVSLPKVARWAWSDPVRPRNAASEARMIACVHRLRRIVAPRGGDCVPYSLVLYHALSRTGADPTLRVGFRRVDGRVDGHAWVTEGDHLVGDTEDNLEGFVVAFSFGRGGAIVHADGP